MDTPRRAMDFRLSNQIPSGFTKTVSLKIEQGYITFQEAAELLNGTATFDITVKTFASIMKGMNIPKEELIKWIKLKGHELLRLKRGNTWRFYIKPNNFKRCYFR